MHREHPSHRLPSSPGWRHAIISLLTVGALVLGAGTSLAQYNTAEISGVVKDEQGGVLPGVERGRPHTWRAA